MLVGCSFQGTQEGANAVPRDAGATLPARDAVDLRIVRAVRDGTGRIIEKETDLAPHERWPDYRSLPEPADRDEDGLPDFWETQFGLDPTDARDRMKLSAGGYANMEHYFNNTHPQGLDEPLVCIAATISRASPAEAGEWVVRRTG